jgi:alkylresorcinol/alkylpyrone synthase
MAETYFTSTDPIARLINGAPQIAGTAVAFPPNRYNQEDVARELTTFAD